jgi:cell division protein FtsW
MTSATASRRLPPPEEGQGDEPGRRPRPARRRPAPRDVSLHLVWVSMTLLLVGGLCMMLSVSTSVGAGDGGRYVYLRDQAIAALVGVVLLVLLARADYRRLRVPSLVFFGAVMLSLFVVHVPGVAWSEGGSESWIGLGALSFQPSEFAKLAVVLLGAHLLSSPRAAGRRFWSYVWPFGVLSLMMCGLVFWEGDLGTAVIIAGLFMGMLWIGGMRSPQWLAVAAAGAAAVLGLTLVNSERLSRVLSFLHPSADPYDSAFQLNQSLVALGRGGWLGVGPGQSVQKYQYLPKAHTDMIYAILGEEFGLVGAGAVIILFGIFAAACWRLARRCSDPMGKYLIAGCGMLVVLQAIVNIGGVIGALPLTGVPLPFISYGRNSLLVMLAAVGLVLSVARRMPAGPEPSRVQRYDNVTHLDRRRWDGRARGARLGAR